MCIRDRATRDIDAVFVPKNEVYDAARQIAEQRDDLEANWLNDAVKGLLLGEDSAATIALEAPGIVVRVASTPYLFALKMLAARVERDEDDIALLYKELDFESADEAVAFLEERFADLPLLPRARYLLEDIAKRT